jgi:uncharacterized protein YgiM (DUF1202 family)
LTAARHKALVEHTSRRRLARIVLPGLAATVLTGSVVGVAVGVADTDVKRPQADVAAAQLNRTLTDGDLAERLEDRQQSVSRSARRVTIEERPEATGHRFSTVALKVREKPTENSRSVDVLAALSKVLVTGESENGFAEIVYDKQSYWVSAEYLVKNKPEPEESEEETAAPDDVEATGGTCTAAPPSGVTSSAMAVYESVCSQFPTITTYGGWRGDGEHSDGTAIDVMVSGDLGWQVAEYLRANASTFGLYDIIYSQKIWTADRSAEGWRYMEDRGSTTANHYDHVHVKVY